MRGDHLVHSITTNSSLFKSIQDLANKDFAVDSNTVIKQAALAHPAPLQVVSDFGCYAAIKPSALQSMAVHLAGRSQVYKTLSFLFVLLPVCSGPQRFLSIVTAARKNLASNMRTRLPIGLKDDGKKQPTLYMIIYLRKFSLF